MPRGRNYLEGLRSKEATVVDKTEEEVKREIRSEGSWGHTRWGLWGLVKCCRDFAFTLNELRSHWRLLSRRVN